MTTPPPANRPGEYMVFLERKVAELEERIDGLVKGQSESYYSGYRAGWNDASLGIERYSASMRRP